MTGVDVEHTKALEAAATPGPWDVLRDGPSIEDSAVDYSIWCEAIGDRLTSEVGEADAEFIAHARTAVPALVAAVERVQAIAEHWSTCPKGDYDCHDCNYNRPEAGDLLLEALKLETP